MSIESFPEHSNQNRPESPQSSELPHLRGLMNLVKDKTSHPNNGITNGGMGRSQWTSPEDSNSVTLRSYDKGVCPDDTQRIGTVEISEKIADEVGKFITDYFITEEKDGTLQINRYFKMGNNYKIKPGDSDQTKLLIATTAISETKKMARAYNNTRKDEDEIGLSHVTEQEVDALTDYLGSLEQSQ